MKFEPGDRVRVIGEMMLAQVGQVGTILERKTYTHNDEYDGKGYYTIQFDGGPLESLWDEDQELPSDYWTTKGRIELVDGITKDYADYYTSITEIER